MTKKVLGVYNSSQEVIQAIENYRNDGHSVKNMSILGHAHNTPNSVEYETGVPTEKFDDLPVNNERQNKGFIDSLVSAFDGNDTTRDHRYSYYDRLVGFGIADGDARTYENDLNSGKILLLEDDGLSDSGGALDRSEEHSLKLREERLDVSKQRVQTGEVEVHKEVVEHEKTVHVPVSREEVYVERRAVTDTDLGTEPINDHETIRIPIVEEKIEVTKKPVVREELVIGKRVVQDTEQVTDTVKREEARVENSADTFGEESNLHNASLRDNRY